LNDTLSHGGAEGADQAALLLEAGCVGRGAHLDVPALAGSEGDAPATQLRGEAGDVGGDRGNETSLLQFCRGRETRSVDLWRPVALGLPSACIPLRGRLNLGLGGHAPEHAAEVLHGLQVDQFQLVRA
jgi:hypothetical protein